MNCYMLASREVSVHSLKLAGLCSVNSETVITCTRVYFTQIVFAVIQS